MSFDPSKTISLPFTITFLNNFYTLLQITNGDYNATLPASDCPFFSHPTVVNFFDYDGHTFDYTKCSNIISGSRDAFFSAVLALASSGPISGTVAVSNFPAVYPVTQAGPFSVSLVPTQTVNIPTPVPVSQATTPWVTSVNFPPSMDVNETQIGGVAYSLGQKVSSSSAPVVIASNQSNIPVEVTLVDVPVTANQGTNPWITSGTSTITGTVTANQGTSPWITSGTSTVSGTVTANQGTSPWITSVGNFPATTAVTQSTSPWVVNETQIGGSAYSLGQKSSANSAPVVIASDQTSLPVSVGNFPATQVVSGTVTANQGTSPWVVSSTSSVPATADIIGASRTTTGTLVTIPANRTFMGSLSLSCSISLLGSALPTISSAGAGVVPTGILHEVIAVGLALSVVSNSNTIGNVYIFGGSAGATITFTQAAAGSSTGQIAGRLL